MVLVFLVISDIKKGKDIGTIERNPGISEVLYPVPGIEDTVRTININKEIKGNYNRKEG